MRYTWYVHKYMLLDYFKLIKIIYKYIKANLYIGKIFVNLHLLVKFTEHIILNIYDLKVLILSFLINRIF